MPEHKNRRKNIWTSIFFLSWDYVLNQHHAIGYHSCFCSWVFFKKSSYCNSYTLSKIVLRAYVLTCQRPCVLTCSRANLSCVLTCSRANVSWALTCSRVIVLCVLTCSRANVPCTLTANLPCVLTYRKYQQVFFWSKINLLPCLVLGWENPID